MSSRKRKTAARNDRLDEAIRLKNRNDFDGALRVLDEILAEDPDDGWVLWFAGLIYWHQEKLSEAIRSFTKAVATAPDSENASLGLFHTLWGAGHHDEAIAEMQRFRSVGHSDDYEEIANEMGVAKPAQEPRKRKRVI